MRTTLHESPEEPTGGRHVEDAPEAAIRRGTQIDQALNLARELLADGPMRPLDVKAAAQARGLRIGDSAWEQARKRLALETVGSGRKFWWRLPEATFEDDFSGWLDTNVGRFAVFYAERQRRLQLMLDPGRHLTEVKAARGVSWPEDTVPSRAGQNAEDVGR
jgi:hypothetical protein